MGEQSGRKRMSKFYWNEKIFVYRLCFGVENICCPTVDKSRVPGKPHDHQKSKKTQDADLSEGHRPQKTVLFTDYVVGRDVLLCLHRSTAPRLFKAKGTAGITDNITSKLQHTSEAAKKNFHVELSVCQND